MKKYSGKLLTSPSPSGNMLYGDKTEKERKKENKEYREKNLNESKEWKKISYGDEKLSIIGYYRNSVEQELWEEYGIDIENELNESLSQEFQKEKERLAEIDDYLLTKK